MNFQSVLAGALASVFVVTSFWADAASANVRIVNDPGGEVSSYVLKFKQVRATGRAHHHRRAMPGGMHAWTGIVPRNRVCVTKRAVLGFHAASYYNDVSRSLVPTRAGTRLLMRPDPETLSFWYG